MGVGPDMHMVAPGCDHLLASDPVVFGHESRVNGTGEGNKLRRVVRAFILNAAMPL